VTRLIALVVPLALDSFAVAAALAVSGLSRHDRIRLSIAFPAFETAMPVVGLGLGRAIAAAVGGAAVYAAAAILVALGTWMVIEGSDDAARLRQVRGVAFFAVGVAISLDELALGFTIGLLRLSLVFALALIAVQAVVASQLGFALGTRLGRRAADAAERVAGVLLIAVGVVFFALEV
jgi:manganese efflux pump family protein